MLTNIGSDRVRSVRALSRRAVRERVRLFLAEGPQVVREAVAHRPDTVQELYFEAQAGPRHTPVLEAARAAGLSIREVSHEVLAAMSDTKVPQGIVAVCRPVDVHLDSVLDQRPRLLVILTNVRDPGNAGTVIRGADAAGADAVLLSLDDPDPVAACWELHRQGHSTVVAVSDRPNTYECVRVLNAGADFYLTKPFSPLDLLTRVDEALLL